MFLALFENIGFLELLIIVVVALLVFGRRLPEVAGQAGAQIARFKRGIEDLRNESGIDKEVRDLQRNLRDVVPPKLSLGDMAKLASAEVEKRLRDQAKPPEGDAAAATSEGDAADGPTADGGPAAPLAPTVSRGGQPDDLGFDPTARPRTPARAGDPEDARSPQGPPGGRAG